MTSLHVVLGAGPLARATAEALLARGKQVRVVSRRGKLLAASSAIESCAADLLDPEPSLRAAQGADALYFCAQPAYHRWPEEFPPLQKAAIALAERTGAKLVAAENLYAYGPVQGPLTEVLPLRPNTRKGKVRAEMHEALMKAHAQGRIRAAVARGSDFFGPHVEQSNMGGRQFRAILGGKPVEVLGDADAPHSLTFVRDFGLALAMLGEEERAIGEVWHVPNAPALSTRAFVERAAGFAGTNPPLRKLGALTLTLVGLFNANVRELGEMRFEWEEPFVVDHRKFASAFGDIATPLEVALPATLEWFRTQA
jgi:nucleoside-diphosphate-sugar epimerase